MNKLCRYQSAKLNHFWPRKILEPESAPKNPKTWDIIIKKTQKFRLKISKKCILENVFSDKSVIANVFKKRPSQLYHSNSIIWRKRVMFWGHVKFSRETDIVVIDGYVNPAKYCILLKIARCRIFIWTKFFSKSLSVAIQNFNMIT